MTGLPWLPMESNWSQLLATLSNDAQSDPWLKLFRLTNCNIDFVQTGKLDRAAQRLASIGIPETANLKPIRLALLGSSTLRHLIPGIRVAGLRRRLWVEVFEGDYSQYFQELTNPSSPLYDFSPTVICFAHDAHYLQSFSNGDVEKALAHIQHCWKTAKEAFSCTVIQQTGMPIFPSLLGSNEHRMRNSPQAFIFRLNAALLAASDDDGTNLLTIDKWAAIDGLRSWHDAALWHNSKQEVHPAVSHKYGEYVMRIVGAQNGRSYKCLVLDLDNTLWGGIIGDDGLQGIKLGNGSPLGEAYLAFQHYLLQLKDRGIILAVCSKNDEVNAFLPFDKHPEMMLKRADIACFVANWSDKVANLRAIAQSLNLGIDSLVFVDDNPYERDFVRENLPEIAVPEMPEDPAMYVQMLSDAGYFEAIHITNEDQQRAGLYHANSDRNALKNSSTDMASYLRELRMEMFCQPFDEASLTRVLQLINKTNQFNLTTRRYSEADVRTIMADPRVLTWQIRLKDRFGDNGIISVIIGKLNTAKEFELETWLMSCRVIGRQVEEACMNVVAVGAQNIGAVKVIGEYRPTAKNSMVRDLYKQFGFQHAGTDAEGNARWSLELDGFRTHETSILSCGVPINAR